jgi:hypothetical protein
MNRLPNECVPQCEKMHRQIERIRESIQQPKTTDTKRRDAELQRQYERKSRLQPRVGHSQDGRLAVRPFCPLTFLKSTRALVFV